MTRRSKLATILFLTISLFFAYTQMKASADVGNHNSYDSGSGSSSSGWDYSGDSNWDYSSSSGYYLGDFEIPSIPVLLIIVALYLWKRSRTNARGRSTGAAPSYTNTASYNSVPDLTPSIEAQIREHDADFSSQKFLAWAEEVFMALQNAWTKRDWKIIRPFESEALFNKHNSQLEEYIRNNTINVVKRICINKSHLAHYSQDNQYEYLTVYMETRMNDYIIDADTRQVVKGDQNREFHTNYKLKFMRSLSVKTTVNSGKSTTNCPNCGAPTQITSAGECEYCNSVITTGQHDWVLCDLDSI